MLLCTISTDDKFAAAEIHTGEWLREYDLEFARWWWCYLTGHVENVKGVLRDFFNSLARCCNGFEEVLGLRDASSARFTSL